MQKILHVYKAKDVIALFTGSAPERLWNAGKLWELKIERKSLNKAHKAV